MRRVVLLVSLLLVLAGVWLLFRGRDEPVDPAHASFGRSLLVTTIAGDGAPGFTDGPAIRARFADPFGIAIDAFGNTYIADAGENNRIRRITPAGGVSTLAGGQEGFADGPGAAAAFNSPSGMTFAPDGHLYVADTGNHAIRRVTLDGLVTTIAGSGQPGFRDGPAVQAEFSGPIGVAVDEQGAIYVADTYNDRIRRITPDGQVSTIAGSGAPGYLDGPALEAMLDTPSGLAVGPSGDLFIADTGNNVIRRLGRDGTLSSVGYASIDPATLAVAVRPIGLIAASDGALFATDCRGFIIRVAPNGDVLRIAGAGHGFTDGPATDSRFGNPTGIAMDPSGVLRVADAGNYLVRQIAPERRRRLALWAIFARQPPGRSAPFPAAPIPRLDAGTLGITELPWPVDPQHEWHELAGTMGEPRGSTGGDGRERFHAGIDVRGDYGATVRSVLDEKVQGPLASSGFDDYGETIAVGILSYTHLRVGRDRRNRPLDPERFLVVTDDHGKPTRVRVRRGTRMRVGDPLGTVNFARHTHLDLGPRDAELNPLTLSPEGLTDYVPPTIVRDGVQLYNVAGLRLEERRHGRVVVTGQVSIIVDAYDQVDDNLERRRLGLFDLGYQILQPSGVPAEGFAEPRMTLRFDRLSADPSAPFLAYAQGSGITVYGRAVTRFLYAVTNRVTSDTATAAMWDTSTLPKGDYLIRIIAADYAGNVALENRDLPITIE